MVMDHPLHLAEHFSVEKNNTGELHLKGMVNQPFEIGFSAIALFDAKLLYKMAYQINRLIGQGHADLIGLIRFIFLSEIKRLRTKLNQKT